MPLYYCPKSFVSEVVSTSRSKTIGEKETHKATIKRQEKEGYSKRKVFFFKRPLNPTYISFKKDKQLKTRTTKRVIMMSQSNDDEKKENMLKRQIRQEDTIMKGSINLQHVAELLRKQQKQHQRQKEKSIFPKFDKRSQISFVNTKYLSLYFGLKSGLKYNKTNTNTICSFKST